MKIISEISKAIRRNPSILRVIVSAHEFELIRDEMWDSDPRTAALPKARLAYEMRYAKIMIMGREVEARR